ncbi:hypothetical protein ADEAN_000794200 [Angomonas deanei]|uniref:Leucine-rich repeat-containing N-terminal plant-type domain-containing protein n=1 Tax=Angomonas deanei TaxID=59799 RepID=A0A7G2CNC3_9TRYP|nr:hypothetical protein ADEAN_000794200 [Angomonas deanei]
MRSCFLSRTLLCVALLATSLVAGLQVEDHPLEDATVQFLKLFRQEFPILRYLWPNNTACCRWRGVACQAEGRVTLQLSGVIPSHQRVPLPSLNTTAYRAIDFSRVQLQAVYLSGNPSVSGTISPRWGDLTQLHTLHLADMNLTGTVPAEVRRQVKELNVTGNAQLNGGGSDSAAAGTVTTSMVTLLVTLLLSLVLF